MAAYITLDTFPEEHDLKQDLWPHTLHQTTPLKVYDPQQSS